MKTFCKLLCIVLAVTILFGMLSIGCSADFRPFFVKGNETASSAGKDPASVPGTQTDPEITGDPDKPSVEEGSTGSASSLETKGLDTFNSKEELLEFVKENYAGLYDRYYVNYATDDLDGAWIEEETVSESAPTSPAGQNGGVSDASGRGEVSDTNLVDENVDEGDILKTDGSYIYIVRDNELIIVSANGKDTDVLSYYKIIAQGEGSINEMYIKGDAAIVIATVNVYVEPVIQEETDFGKPVDSYESDSIEIYDYYNLYPYYYERYTTYSAVYVIDISDREKPREISCNMIEGYLLSSREMNGRIYLVANKNFGYYYGRYNGPYLDEVLPVVYSTDEGFSTVEATSIVRPIFENVSSSIMTLAVIDYQNGKNAETISILGSGSDIYMTAESLYIFGHSYYAGDVTSVAKYSVGDTLSYVASVTVPGYTATDFSYNEYNGKFRIATTTYNNEGTVNNVYVYDANLKKIGELTGLAPKEKIYSVRFSGDVAYVVTFRQVDPLFVIDMSGNDPKVMGELKVPGFSTYLHPVGNGLLLGIGKETKDEEYSDYYGNKYTSTYTVGMKISLFDVSDPFNPREIDVVNMVGGEYAYSEALDNYKAFVYSNVRKTGYFAIDTMDSEGFVCVEVLDGKLECKVVKPRRTDNNWYGSYGSRVCFVEDTLYFYQYNRIIVYDRDTLEETAVVTVK